MSENPFSSVTDLLFVYGTLMQGSGSEFAAYLHRFSTYVGRGWFSGYLYQIDWFPGAIYNQSARTRVWGEVYQLQQSANTLAHLDTYEGVDDDPPVYSRCVVPVTLTNQLVSCQAYLYNLKTANLVLIESGEFRMLV